jgi:hypothetical protein
MQTISALIISVTLIRVITIKNTIRILSMKKLLTSIAVISVVTFSGMSFADGHKAKSADYMPSLITKTPLEGRNLAITIVRKTVGAIQRDGKIKHAVRDVYEKDPMMLMRSVELVNKEFAIIAIANNYWR